MRGARQSLSVLRGLAILAVVCNHTSMLGLNRSEHYGLIVMNQLPMFSVPSFLFLTGYFIAYAARGHPPSLSRDVIRARLKGILIPYLIWSLVIYAGQIVTGKGYTVIEFGRRLLLGQVALPHYFVPLLVQFYLLAPFLIRHAKLRPRLLLLASSLVQLTMTGLFYMRIYHVPLPRPLTALIDAGAILCLRWPIFFTLGAVVWYNKRAFKTRLAPIKWWLLAAAILLGLGSIVESEIAKHYVDTLADARHMTKLSTTLFALATILFFVALDRVRFPLTSWLDQLGTRSYGIYLIHYHVLLYSQRAIEYFAPWLLPRTYLLQVILLAVGLSVPLLLMYIVAKSPLRRTYRWVFG